MHEHRRRVEGVNFDGKTLADIFRGAITNWSDRRIRTPNPGVSFPNAPITLCVRSDGSGTSFNFTSYLSKVNPSFRSSVGASQSPRGRRAAHRREGRAQPGVAQLRHEPTTTRSATWTSSDARNAGLTRFFARIGKTETVKKNGKRVRATRYILRACGSGSKAGNLKTVKPDLTVSLTASPAPGAYPITTTTWILAYSQLRGGRQVVRVA